MSQIKLSGNPSGTGTLTIASPNTNSDYTLNLPASSGTVLADGASQSPTFNGVTATTLTVNSNNISAVNSLGFRNRIINGDMRIDQRNNGASVGTGSGSDVYSLDRWQLIYSQTSKFTVQRNAGSVTPPAGYTNYLGATSSSAYSVGATDYFGIRQNIEGFNMADFAWGTASAQSVTLSFWVRSSLTGTFAGAMQNNAANRFYVFSYTISAANTWEYKTITIAGDTSGTWLTDTGAGVRMTFSIGVGSTYSVTPGSWGASPALSATGATSVVGTNGATFYITGVQLEAGTVASPFERRPYGTELALCQRYYWRSTTTNSGFAHIGFGMASSTTTADIQVRYPVPMRTSPSSIDYATVVLADSVFTFAITGLGLNAAQSSQYVANVQATGATGLTQYRSYFLVNNNNSTGYVGFNAEL